jgi:drug/metabolite transporter (DMT)-like permease
MRAVAAILSRSWLISIPRGSRADRPLTSIIPGIEDRARTGIAMMLVAWVLFSFVDTSAKWLGALALPAVQIAFFRYLGHFVISSVIVLRDPDRLRIPPHFLLVSLRGTLLLLGTMSNFWALKFLPLTITSAIMFSSPVLVCFLSVAILKERVGIWRWAAILLGFVGVLIVVRPFGAEFHPAMLLAVANAGFLAVYSLLTRALAGKVSTDIMQVWMGIWGTLTLLPFAVWFWQPPQDATAWALLFGIGVFAWAGHQLLTIAHRYATANTLMPFTYSYLLYLTVLGYLVFADVPSVWTLLGAGVIMLSGLIIWYREGRAEVPA